MTRPFLLLAVPLVLLGCADDGATDFTTTTTAVTDDRPAPDEGAQGTVVVRLEPTQGIFVEGFEIGLRFDDGRGEELKRITWSEHVASLGDAVDPYTAVLEQAVPAGTVRLGVDVNIGIGPGPEPPDLDADRLPCELDLEVGAGETVEVEVAFDDSGPDCALVVE